MLLLIAFSFIAGVVTVLSPCILPLLPIILSSTVDSPGKARPLGVVAGFTLSFTFFTLFLTTLVKLTGIPGDTLRLLSVVILFVFGLTLLIPKAQFLVEQVFAKFTQYAPRTQNKGFFGGLLVGFSLGLLWTPCVGPILASVISLALTSTVNIQAFFVTFAYAIGTSIPMFLIMLAGINVLKKVPWLLANTAKIQKAFGVLMILTSIGILLGIDKKFQAYILDTFPSYGTNLTKLEQNQAVLEELQNLK